MFQRDLLASVRESLHGHSPEDFGAALSAF